MATILLTEDEYTHVQGLADDLLGRIENASPRAATHYSVIAKLHADFIANEDAKRAKTQKRASNRERIQNAKEIRRNRRNAAQTAQGTGQRTGTASTVHSPSPSA